MTLKAFNMRGTLLPPLAATVQKLTLEYDQISAGRKDALQKLAQIIESKVSGDHKIYLHFICTHNSRRSHLAQLWAQAAAHYYGVPNVFCYSGGTESTSFNFRAVKAMQDVGFNITKTKEGENPIYEIRFSNDAQPVTSFSKKYDDPFNHSKDFTAIMTCSQADENCPLVSGASGRLALTYDDPKEFDGTAHESVKYAERVHQIGREIFYAFSQVSNHR